MRKRKKSGQQFRRQIERANAEMDRRSGGSRVIELGPIEIGHGAYRLHAGAGCHSGKSIHDVATKKDGITTLTGLVQSGRLKADDQEAVLAYLRAGGGVRLAARRDARGSASFRKVSTCEPRPAHGASDGVGSHVMRYGAYKGRTVAEVASTGGGREYLNSLLAKKKVPLELRRAILDHAMWFNKQAGLISETEAAGATSADSSQ
jgi:hypothetical protein